MTHELGNGQWAIGNWQWAMGNWQWPMGNGQEDAETKQILPFNNKDK